MTISTFLNRYSVSIIGLIVLAAGNCRGESQPSSKNEKPSAIIDIKCYSLSPAEYDGLSRATGEPQNYIILTGNEIIRNTSVSTLWLVLKGDQKNPILIHAGKTISLSTAQIQSSNDNGSDAAKIAQISYLGTSLEYEKLSVSSHSPQNYLILKGEEVVKNISTNNIQLMFNGKIKTLIPQEKVTIHTVQGQFDKSVITTATTNHMGARDNKYIKTPNNSFVRPGGLIIRWDKAVFDAPLTIRLMKGNDLLWRQKDVPNTGEFDARQSSSAALQKLQDSNEPASCKLIVTEQSEKKPTQREVSFSISINDDKTKAVEDLLSRIDSDYPEDSWKRHALRARFLWDLQLETEAITELQLAQPPPQDKEEFDHFAAFYFDAVGLPMKRK